MASKYSMESTSRADSVDSCMNEAMIMSSAETISDSVCDAASNPSRSVATTGSFVGASEINAAGLPSEATESSNVSDAQEPLAGSIAKAKSFIPPLILTDSHYTVQILSHSADTSDGRCCESLVELMNSSIQSSNIWPALNVLRKRLCDVSVEDDAENQDDEVMEDLLEKFENDPQNFTHHLCTIIEESSDFCVSEIASDPTSPPSGSVHSDSTQYMSFKRYGWRNEREFRENNGPIGFASKKTPDRIIGATDENWPRSPRGESAKCIAETPKIVVIPSTPKPSRRASNLESPKNCIEDEEYVTAESEIDENSEDATILDPDKSTTETTNISKVAQRHEEWAETFDRVSKYEPTRKPLASSAIDGRKERFKRHSNKLEKRWMRELAKKRQKCFDTIKDLLVKVAAEKSEGVADESAQCACDRCKRQTGLYNTLVAASDFYTHACNKNNSRSESRPTVAKKNRRSLSRSPAKPRREDVSNSRETSTKKATRKSVGKRIKSPSVRYKSPRRSVVAKSYGKRSPARGRNKAGTDIDVSSIKPVSQLRMIFSPHFKPSGPAESKMVPPRMAPRAYPSPRKQCGSNFMSPAAKAKFRHVKSPVAEYIRGKKI